MYPKTENMAKPAKTPVKPSSITTKTLVLICYVLDRISKAFDKKMKI
jgi:hypothetical protein